MEKKKTCATGKLTPKKESAEAVAVKIGASPSAVYCWRSSGTLPKNPLIRAAYLKLTNQASK